MERAEPKPFFYTRLSARMNSSRETVKSAFELAPVYRRVIMSSLAILVTINVVTVSLLMGNGSNMATDSSQEEVYFEQYYMPMATIDNLESQLTE